MNTRVFIHLIRSLVFLALLNLCPLHLFAQPYNAPTYRGKVVLVVDKTIATDPDVSCKIQRVIDDLTGDGWRVLRHDVERGPVPPSLSGNPADYVPWYQQNAPRVREIRALIRADYDAAPGDVKNVFLIGHIPVPYSGQGDYVGDGGHYSGAQPADSFYGDMTSAYGATGWADFLNDPGNASDNWPQFWNIRGDGKFDQDSLPSPMSLGVGRVDLYAMPSFGVNETTLLSRYLNKDHDFRNGALSIPRSAIFEGYTDPNWPPGIFCVDPSIYAPIFGDNNVAGFCGGLDWYNFVGTTNYLFGYNGGPGFPFTGSGATSTGQFAANDSRVVFMNIYGSFVGDWDEQDDLLRAVLSNPYDPANGRFGYGLTALWGQFGLNLNTLTKQTLGATIGEALFVGYQGDTHFGLMGDPTLRMHSVQGPSGVTASASSSTVVLNWTASPDGAVSGYNVYSAPTRTGPYILVNTSGAISGNTYSATRPASGSAPDNFYMVRAVKPETTPVGNYGNMSEGIIVPAATTFTPCLTILSQPASQKIAAITQDGIANSVVFSVDAVGADSAGDGQITYQWYYNGNPLVDGGRIHGSTSSALLISGVQDSDVGSYYVMVGNGQPIGSTGTPILSSTATLTIKDSPVAVDDSINVIRNTPTDLNVLANDSNPGGPNSALTVVSISALSNPNAGTITINPDNRTIHFVPATCFLGTVTFTYAVSDGFTASQATVTVTVVPNPNDQPPTVTPSPIPNQAISEYATLDIPFTASDNYTIPDDLQISVASSDPTIILPYNVWVTGAGGNYVLAVRAVGKAGTCNVTLTVEDCDLQVTTLTFAVTVSPDSTPALVATGLQSDGFHFTVVDPANSTVQIKESADLVTWTSLGNVTLSGGLYNFVDSTVGSATQRFYSAVDANGCSVNKIGFVNVVVPAKNSAGSLASVALGNPLNNPAGNTLGVLFAALPKGSFVSTWNALNQGYTIHHKIGTPPVWTTTTVLNPGTGAAVHAGGTAPVTVTFIGDVPTGQQVNSFTIDSSLGGDTYALLSSVIPLQETLDQLGFPAVEGDEISELASDGVSWITVATYSGGSWTPSSPTLQAAEAFFLSSVNSGSRTWTEYLPTCCDPAPSGIISWWPAEGNADDIIGGNNGAPVGNLTYVSGEVGQAFVFDGSTSYIPLASSPSLDVGSGSGFTIEGWIVPASGTTAPIVEWDSSSSDGLQFWVNNGTQLYANLKDTSGGDHTLSSASGVLNNTSFQHVALTYDQASGNAYMFLNGAIVASANFGNITPQTSYQDYNLNIGRRTGQPVGLNDTYQGLLDELSIYGRALSQSEISAIYAAGSLGKCFTPPPCDPVPSGIVGWWPAEGNTDDTIGGNNGSINGGVTYSSGEVGQSFLFDGTSGYVSIPASSSLDVGSGTGMTIECWIWPNNLGPGDAQPIVEWDDPDTVGVQLWLENPYTLFGNLRDASGTDYMMESAAGTINTTGWQHVAETYDQASGNAYLYINGVQVASANFGTITPNTSLPLYFGTRAANGYPGSGDLYSGGLDEVSIYNRALSPSEISAIYAAGHSGKCSQ